MTLFPQNTRKPRRVLGAAVAALLLCGAQAAEAGVLIYDFTPTASGNTVFGTTKDYASSPVSGIVITATVGTYAGALGSPAGSAFTAAEGFRLVGNNRGSEERGLGVCVSASDCSGSSLAANSELDYSTKEVIRLDITNLFSAFGSHFKIDADSTTGGELLGVFNSGSATSIGTKLLDISDETVSTSISPTGAYLYFISDSAPTSSGNGGDVLLHSLSVTVPEPASLALLGAAALGICAIRRRGVVG